MKKELIYSTLILATGVIVAYLVAVVPALAQNGGPPEIDFDFPVAELGNCESEAECKQYCSDVSHLDACLTFAEAHGLMSQREIAEARRFSRIDFDGPGGCTTNEECEAYCDDITHINECIAFAEEHDILPPEDLEEARAVRAAIERGVQPPACKSKRECDSYCQAPDHMRECIAFGEASGFLKGRELEDAKRILGAIEKGVAPLPCREKEECDLYCAEEENFQKCIDFGEAAGFMSPEEAAMARKTGGKGPGECSSKEECEAFCQNPSNNEICFAFAREHDLIPQEEIQKMENWRADFRSKFESAPPEAAECLRTTIGIEAIEKFAYGVRPSPRDMGDKMHACFDQFKPTNSSFQGQPGDFYEQPKTGPGGCNTSEECQAYCIANPNECGGFGSPPPEFQDHGDLYNEKPPEYGTYPTPDSYQPPQDNTYQSPPTSNFNEPPPKFQNEPSTLNLEPELLLGLLLRIFVGL